MLHSVFFSSPRPSPRPCPKPPATSPATGGGCPGLDGDFGRGQGGAHGYGQGFSWRFSGCVFGGPGRAVKRTGRWSWGTCNYAGLVAKPGANVKTRMGGSTTNGYEWTRIQRSDAKGRNRTPAPLQLPAAKRGERAGEDFEQTCNGCFCGRLFSPALPVEGQGSGRRRRFTAYMASFSGS